MFDFQEELRKLPDQPGVYIMHDKTDAIIYIGKAVSLRKRVRQYFQPSHDEGIKKKQMVEHIARFEYIITDSELEALVLECNLIKEHTPKYNTMLRDDKTYPYIRVTVQEDFPRVLFSRQVKKDKSRYFGPYTSAGAVKDTIELINKLYKLRTCSRKLPRDIGLDRACLNYHIHQCGAPCQGYVDKETYGKQVSKALEFLNGNYAPVLRELKEKMQEASEEMEFERAIEYRELLNSVSQIAQKQKITNTDGEDKDIIALASDDRDAVVQVFYPQWKDYRKGSFSCACGIRRKHRGYSGKFRETVLFWDAVCPAGNHAPGSNRRHSGAGRMAECQTRAESDDTDSAERTQRKAGGAGCEKCTVGAQPG